MGSVSRSGVSKRFGRRATPSLQKLVLGAGKLISISNLNKFTDEKVLERITRLAQGPYRGVLLGPHLAPRPDFRLLCTKAKITNSLSLSLFIGRGTGNSFLPTAALEKATSKKKFQPFSTIGLQTPNVAYLWIFCTTLVEDWLL